jgi:polar amino acid transport system substrate-binding protein
MRALLIVIAAVFGSAALAQAPSAEQKAAVAPTGALRAAIVTIPFLARRDAASGALNGVAPDLAAEMARILGVPYRPSAFDSPNAGIKALRDGAADVTFLAPTPERAGLIDFSPAFMGMEVTLIVPEASPIRTLADADQPGRRIVVYERTANDEMVQKRFTRAGVRHVPLFAWKQAFDMLKAGEADAYVDLRDQLASHQAELPGSRILAESLGRNAMAIGYPKDRPAATVFMKQFIDTVISLGTVKRSIERAGIKGAVVPNREL